MSRQELLDFLNKSHQALDMALNKIDPKSEDMELAKAQLVSAFRIELMRKLFTPGSDKS